MFALFSTNPYAGHFFPLVPLAAALRNAGHEVVFATTAAFATTVTGAGFPVLPAGIEPVDAWPWEEPVTRVRTRDLLSLAEQRGRPHVIVREMTDFGAVVAAEVLGIPHVTVAGGLCFETEAWRRLVRSDVDRVRARYGVPPDRHLDRLYVHGYIDTTPRWFQVLPIEAIPTHRFFRVPTALARTTGPRLIYVTLGTVFNKRPHLWRALVEGVATLGLDVLCTIGRDQRPDDVFPEGVPGNVTVVPYVSQEDVLPRCGAVVTHGGFSTLMAALRHGVPPLVVPLGADHPPNARRCVHLGIGRALWPSRATPAAVGAAVDNVIRDPTYRDHLRALRRTEGDVPPVGRAVDLIERIASAGARPP